MEIEKTAAPIIMGSMLGPTFRPSCSSSNFIVKNGSTITIFHRYLPHIGYETEAESYAANRTTTTLDLIQFKHTLGLPGESCFKQT